MEKTILTNYSEADFASLLKRTLLEIMGKSAADEPAVEKKPATKQEVAEYLGISMPTLDIMIKTGQIKSFNIGRSVRFKWSEVEAYVNSKGN